MVGCRVCGCGCVSLWLWLVYWHHGSVFGIIKNSRIRATGSFHMRAWCQHTRGRCESTHGGRFERTHALSLPPATHHTHKKGQKRRRNKVTASSAHQKKHQSYHLAPEVHQRNPWILQMFSLRIGREQHVPYSSNQSLCLIQLFSFSIIAENFGGNQLPDSSISFSPSTTNTTTTQHHTKHTETDTHREKQHFQACFTIFQVLTCVSHSLSRSRYQ